MFVLFPAENVKFIEKQFAVIKYELNNNNNNVSNSKSKIILMEFGALFFRRHSAFVHIEALSLSNFFAIFDAFLPFCGSLWIGHLLHCNHFLSFGTFDHQFSLNLRTQNVVFVVADSRADRIANMDRDLTQTCIDILIFFGHFTHQRRQNRICQFIHDFQWTQFDQTFDPSEY